MSKLHPEKFFNDFEPLETRLNKDSGIQYEKIRLEFSILHANVGIYRIQAKLFDNQLFPFGYMDVIIITTHYFLFQFLFPKRASTYSFCI